MGAGETERLAQELNQQGAGLDRPGRGLAVHRHLHGCGHVVFSLVQVVALKRSAHAAHVTAGGDFGHFPPPLRRWSTPTPQTPLFNPQKRTTPPSPPPPPPPPHTPPPPP